MPALEIGDLSGKGVQSDFNYLVSLNSACATQGLISKHKQNKYLIDKKVLSYSFDHSLHSIFRYIIDKLVLMITKFLIAVLFSL